MTAPLNDHRLLPQNGAAPRHVIIFLHGLGDRGDGGLLEVGHLWLQALPDCAFLCPDAPFPFDMAPPEFGGRQWFSLQEFSHDEMLRGAITASPHLNAYIDQVLAEFKLTPDKLILAGFSQGTMMALYTALRRERPVAGIIGYSGMLLGEETLDAEIKSKMPVLLVHGTRDAVVPFRAMAAAEAVLKGAGIAVTTLRTTSEHTIDGDGVDAGLHFIKNIWRTQ